MTIKDVSIVERMVGRITKILPGSEDHSYQEGLERQDRFSLEQKMLRSDLIEVYKIIGGMGKLKTIFFPMVEVAKPVGTGLR